MAADRSGKANADVLRSIFEVATRIRTFDTRVIEMISTGQAAFVHYSVKGQELIPAALAQCLEPTDYVLTTYRALHDEVATGVPLRDMWAEFLGKRTGASKGKGGPMHVCAPDVGLMLSTGVVGGGPPVANGLAMATQLLGDGRVTVCNFGDGASNTGSFHEAMNLAALWRLPVVFVCQNNQYAEHTPFAAGQRNESVVERAAGYGMHGVRVDGNDATAMYEAARAAVERARRGEGPVFLECTTYRLGGHVLGDDGAYMDADALQRATDADPVPRLRAQLLDLGHLSESEATELEARIATEVEDALQLALQDPVPSPDELTQDVVGPVRRSAEPGATSGETRSIDLRSAVNEALDEAMAADPSVVLLGEDIADSAGGGVFKVTAGLSTKYGEERVRNTPISESAIIGAGTGGAMAGLRPVAEIMFLDFIGVCFDQLANHAAKLRYMSGGQTAVPLTVRMGMAGGLPIGAQHTQSLEAMLMHVPGLRVVWPSTPYDAKGLMRSCIEDDDPCIFVESIVLLAVPGPVPSGDYRVPIGVADVKRPGDDVTVVTYGRQVFEALAAAEALAEEGISVEVVDLRSLAPLDLDTVLTSVAKTRRAVVVHDAVRQCGPGAEIAAAIHEHLHGDLLAPVRRLAAPDVPVPASMALVGAMYPGRDGVAEAVRAMAG